MTKQWASEDLTRLARRIAAVADNVRRIHNEIELPLSLAQALSSLQKAEALLLEAARTDILCIYLSHARDRYNAALDGPLDAYLVKARKIFEDSGEWQANAKKEFR